MKVFAYEIDGVLTHTLGHAIDTPVIKENVEAISRWALAGMVPTIVTARPKDERILTEHYLAKNSVAYGSLLVGVDTFASVGQLLWHSDSSFFITSDPHQARRAMSPAWSTYVLRRPWNKEREKAQKDYDYITYVDDLSEIAHLEGIK
jgi:hypothetical protein